MTILNGIVQGKLGHIITDTAWCHSDGTVGALASKFIVGQAFPFLIAFTGNCLPHYTADRMNEAYPHNGDELLEVLSTVLREHSALEPQLDVGLMVMTWSKRLARPLLHLLRNDAFALSEVEHLVPFEPLQLEAFIGGAVTPGEALRRPVNILDRRSFDPHRDGAALMEVQRRHHRFENLTPPAHRIGGAVQVATLGRRGTLLKEILEWPEDQVGRLIQPKVELANGESILALC